MLDAIRAHFAIGSPPPLQVSYKLADTVAWQAVKYGDSGRFESA
jgi:hypothetical protein